MSKTTTRDLLVSRVLIVDTCFGCEGVAIPDLSLAVYELIASTSSDDVIQNGLFELLGDKYVVLWRLALAFLCSTHLT